jgi:hypothetical protein
MKSYKLNIPTKFIKATIVLTIMALSFAALRQPVKVASAGELRTDALVLVNQNSANYIDFQQFIQPYLDHFGVPYTVLDITSTAVGTDIGDYALVIVGHRSLDPSHAYLNLTEEGYISAAVNAGSGLVNFDNDLALGLTSRYQYIDDIFGFDYIFASSGSDITFTAEGGENHYITARHSVGETVTTGSMTLAKIDPPVEVQVLATTASQPLLAVNSYGEGQAVQWGSYNWASHAVKGPVYGLDDLVWRSLVWASRKPFVMQGLPNFVTMRVDDVSGPFWWINIANEFGIKPWAGLFYHDISVIEGLQLSALVNDGNATTAIHANSELDFFYYNHGVGDHADEVMDAYYDAGTSFHNTYNIPISKFVLPHFYEFGTNAFQGLHDWGVEFVGTVMEPGWDYGAYWAIYGPYRLYEVGTSADVVPFTYADFLTVAGHPEFNKEFFNCLTEIRDDAGYEWYPDNDVPGSIGRGTRQTQRALDSMALATLFTHGYYLDDITQNNWRAMLQGITDNLAPYNPIYVTIDYACQYVRATYTSDISFGTFDPATGELRTTLTGETDLPTQFYLFTEEGGAIQEEMVEVPVFNGSTEVVHTIIGPLDHFSFEPIPAPVWEDRGFQVTISARDSAGNLVTDYTGQVTLSDTTGTIQPTVSGAFVGGTWAGEVVIEEPAREVVITASDGDFAGMSGSFDVLGLTYLPFFGANGQ